MKLRIKGNSIRLRLSKEEVDQLVESEQVWSRCDMPINRLTYGIELADVEEMSAAFKNSKLRVVMPRFMVANWHTSDLVGFDHTDSNDLYILVEKDFKCLVPRPNEDETQLYKNPLSNES